MRNICYAYLVAQPPALSSWRKRIWALPDRREKAHDSLLKQGGSSRKWFSCEPPSRSQLFEVPGEEHAMFSDSQGSKPLFPWGPSPRKLHFPGARALETLAGLSAPRRRGLHLNFLFNKQTSCSLKNFVVLLPFINLKHISNFISFIYFLFYRRFYI